MTSTGLQVSGPSLAACHDDGVPRRRESTTDGVCARSSRDAGRSKGIGLTPWPEWRRERLKGRLTAGVSGERGEAARVHCMPGLDRRRVARGSGNAGRGTAGTWDPKRALARRGRKGRPARSLATLVERASKELSERRRWRSGHGAPERRCEKLRSNRWRQRRAARSDASPLHAGLAGPLKLEWELKVPGMPEGRRKCALGGASLRWGERIVRLPGTLKLKMAGPGRCTARPGRKAH